MGMAMEKAKTKMPEHTLSNHYFAIHVLLCAHVCEYVCV